MCGTAYSDNQKESQRPCQERKEVLKKFLKELHSCKTYNTLKVKCQQIKTNIERFTINAGDIGLCSNELQEDLDAAKNIPYDIPSDKELCPCELHADGNCLPSCGSVLAFGVTDHVDEIRVRIVVELVENENKYLDDNLLSPRNSMSINRKKKAYPSKNYAQYSDTYIPGTKLNRQSIQKLYRAEVMAVKEDKCFMGIWQIHALASVLETPIYSVYPNRCERI